MGADPPKADWVHLLPRLRDMELVTQTEQHVVEPCCKKVHLRLAPPGAYQLEDIWKE